MKNKTYKNVENRKHEMEQMRLCEQLHLVQIDFQGLTISGLYKQSRYSRTIEIVNASFPSHFQGKKNPASGSK